MTKEMSTQVQKNLLLINAALNTLKDYEGVDAVSALVDDVGLDSLLDTMEEYFGYVPYDTDLLYSIVKGTTEELRNFKEE